MRTSLLDLPWPLETERLVLRPQRDTDLAAIHRYRSLPDVGRWIGSLPGTLAEMTDRMRSPDHLARAVVVELDGEVVADLMLRVGDAWSQREVTEEARATEAELGWVLDPAHGGRGFATEAVRALIGVAFDGLGLRRVTAGCFVANEPSWRLMERVGMRREQHGVADALHRELGWLDGCTYALLASEWRVGADVR